MYMEPRILTVTDTHLADTVKPFNLAAVKVDDFACKIIFGAFYFGEFKPHNSNTWVMPVEVATVSIFTPLNFAVSLSSRNSQNKGHANIKGFTVKRYTLVASGVPFLYPSGTGDKLHQFGSACRFKSAWPVSRPVSILKLVLDRCRAYLVKLRFACLRSCLAWRYFVALCHCCHCSLHAQCCNSLHTFGDVMPRTGSAPVYFIAEVCLDRPSAISFPRMPQCPSVHTSRTLLCTDCSFRAQTVSVMRAEFTFGVMSVFSAAWLLEHIATDALFLNES